MAYDDITDPGLSDAFAAWLRAFQANDIPAILDHYADDIVSYDAVQGLRLVGKAATRKHYDEGMGSIMGEGSVMVFEPEEPQVSLAGDLAVMHFICVCGGSPDPATVPVVRFWARVTQVWREWEGRWLVVHDHYSQPFDPATGKVLFDAQP